MVSNFTSRFMINYCSVSKTQNELKIVRDWTNQAKGYLISFTIYIVMGFLFLFITIISLFHTNEIPLLYDLVPIILFIISGNLCFKNFKGYVRTRGLKTELIFDILKGEIYYNNLEPKSKYIRTIKFSEINSLLFHQIYSNTYSLEFVFPEKTINNKFEITDGSKEDCLKLGKILAQFLNIPLYDTKIRKLYEINV